VAKFADAETIEILDRIIGGNIHSIQVHDAIISLKAFMVAEQARPKIFAVLLKHIKDNVEALTVHELCELALLLRNFGDSYEGLYDLIEPFIVSKINSLS
jgi:hypothetical protein